MQNTGGWVTCFCVLSDLTRLSQELFLSRDGSNVPLGLPSACLAQTWVGGSEEGAVLQ